MTDFPIIPSKTAMLFFDTLNVYLHSDDPRRRAQPERMGVIPRMQRIDRACRDAGIAIFYAQGDHRPDYKDFLPHVVDDQPYQPGPRPRRTVPPPVVSGSRGAEIIPELEPQAGDYIIKKHRWSSFFQTHLELSLRTAGIETIMLSGGHVEVGIASTAYSARDRDFNLIILSDACTAVRPETHLLFMEKVFPIFGRVMTVDQAIALIERS